MSVKIKERAHTDINGSLPKIIFCGLLCFKIKPHPIKM